MSSALKPALTQTSPQNQSVVSAQINKPMHPQGAQTTYGQPTAHIPQNLVNIPPANAHSGNYYSINVPNAPQHYMGGNAPASNHPVPVSQPPNTQQMYSPSKSTTYTGGYQSNLSHSPNVLPPVTQTLPPTSTTTTTTAQQQPPPATSQPSDTPAATTTTTTDTTNKPQANGTPEKQPPPKSNNTEPQQQQQQQNHVAKEKPTPVPAVEKTPEKVAEVLKEKTPEVQQQKSATTSSPQTNVSANAAATTVSSSAVPAAQEQQNKVGGGSAPVASGAQSASPQAKPKEQTSQAQPQPQQQQQQQQQNQQQQKASTTLKLATTPRPPNRKPKPTTTSPTSNKTETATTEPAAVASKVKTEVAASASTPTKTQKTTSPSTPANPVGKSKRTRIQTQPYQSPLPELEIISKMTSSSTPKNRNDEKLIVFYKNEFLAVRNSEGSFYVCQAVQNIYKTSQKIKIRWLSQDKNDKTSEIYTPDFYDHTDFDCILTNLNLSRVEKGKFRLPPAERVRTDSILKRALAVEKGDAVPPSPTEEHPDGLDLSLYKEESQLKQRRGKKRKSTSPLKTTKRAKSTTKKSPDVAKVRKIAAAPAKVVKKKTGKVTKSKVVVKKQLSEVKKVTQQGRAERAAKRRGPDGATVTAKSPSVVDQKKAKVLAKVARKSVQKNQAAAKTTKATRSTGPASKVQKSTAAVVASSSKAQQTVTRKTKRSTRK